MDTQPANGGPAAAHRRRLADRNADIDALEALGGRYSWARLAVAGVLAALVVAALGPGAVPAAWTLLPAAVFLALVHRHDTVLRRLARRRRAADFHRRALDRLDGRWVGVGPTGEEAADAGHPYAPDLDVVGRGSLFQLICAARTSVGESTLAAWLLGPAPPSEIAERQRAVAELRPRLGLREELFLLGDDVRGVVDLGGMVAWGEGPTAPLPWRRILGAAAMTAVTSGVLVAWALALVPVSAVLAVLLVHMVVHWRMRGFVDAVAGTVERPAGHLALTAAILERIGREAVESRRLVSVRERLTSSGAAAWSAVAALGRCVERLGYRRNMMFALPDFLLFWSFHHAVAVEAWRRRHGAAIRPWLDAVGEFEALLSLAGYAFEHPEDPFPEIREAPGALLQGEGLAHPLLPETRAVRNDVDLGAGTAVWVVSGSNMSGKSTLLRAVGLNAVLAFAGAPVRARRLVLSPLRLGASIRLVDSVLDGRSRFYAEVLRLKQIVDLAEGPGGTLFLLDEIFHGTNSHDRRIGAEMLVRHLTAVGAVGLVTTHDLALARLAETLAPAVANVHFEDELVDGELRFDYRLRPGTVRRSNAVDLMRAVGLPVS